MKRGWRRLMLCMVLGWALPTVSHQYWTQVFRMFQEWNLTRAVGDVERSHTYVVTRGSALTFAIPAGTTVVRVLATLNVADGREVPYSEQHRPGWLLPLRYRLVDRAGHTVREATHTLRSTPQRFRTPDGQMATGTFYAESNLSPLATQEFRIKLSESERSTGSIVFASHEFPEGLVDVGLRVSAWQQNGDYQRAGEWERLSPRRRETLARASVRPAELLTQQERINLLHWNWKPLAPTGVEGRNYHRRTLFVRSTDGLQEIDDDPIEQGLTAAPRRWVSFAVPPGEGTLYLHAERIAASRDDEGRLRDHPTNATSPQADAMPGADGWQLHTTWYPHDNGPAIEQSATSTGSQHTETLSVQDGLLVAYTSLPTRLRAYWVARPGTLLTDSFSTSTQSLSMAEEIVPTRRVTWVHPAHTPGALHFPISHLGHRATPVRVSARRVLTEDELNEGVSRPCRFGWRMHDRAGTLVARGQCEDLLPASLYDRMRDTEAPMTEARRYYFRIPPTVDQLILNSDDAHVLLQVDTALADRPSLKVLRPVALPSDQAQSRDWYPLQPREADSQKKYEVERFMLSQIRPPDDDRDSITQPSYRWDDCRPLLAGPGRFLLTPRENGHLQHRESQRSLYVPLSDALSAKIPLDPPADRRFIYRFPPERTYPIAVRRPLDEPVTHGWQGETRSIPDQPKFSPPRGGDAEWFVSVSPQAMIEHTPTYTKRFAYLFDDLDEVFEVQKLSNGAENVTIRYYRSAECAGDAELHITLDELPNTLNGPAVRSHFACQSLTWGSWTFRVAAPNQNLPPAWVLGTREGQVYDIGPCTITLGDDLPAGRYCLRVRRSMAEKAYIAVSRTALNVPEAEDATIVQEELLTTPASQP